jgi:hypothetical protein
MTDLLDRIRLWDLRLDGIIGSRFVNLASELIASDRVHR